MPISAGIQVGGGLLQMVLSGKKKAEKDLEKHANSHTPSGSLLDFYNKALNRYSTNPYDNPLFQTQSNIIQRNLTTGIGAAATRRGGLAALSPLVQSANDATAQAAVRADQQNQNALGVLGGAARMKAGEESKKFDMLYNLKSMKAGAAANTFGAGLNNTAKGVMNLSTVLRSDDDDDNDGADANFSGLYSPTKRR